MKVKKKSKNITSKKKHIDQSNDFLTILLKPIDVKQLTALFKHQISNRITRNPKKYTVKLDKRMVVKIKAKLKNMKV